MLNILLAFTLSFTYPTHDAIGCQELGDVNRDLAEVEVHFEPQYAGRDTVLHIFNAVGKQGQLETFASSIDTPGVVWVVALDAARNRSCQSAHVGVNLPLGVDNPIADEQRMRWYDVAGRKYDVKPTMPGVYIQVWNGKKRKVVIF